MNRQRDMQMCDFNPNFPPQAGAVKRASVLILYPVTIVQCGKFLLLFGVQLPKLGFSPILFLQLLFLSI